MNPSSNQYNQIQQPSETPIQGSMMNLVSNNGGGQSPINGSENTPNLCISPPISQEDHGNLVPVNESLPLLRGGSQSPTNGPYPTPNMYTSPPISQMCHGNLLPVVYGRPSTNESQAIQSPYFSLPVSIGGHGNLVYGAPTNGSQSIPNTYNSSPISHGSQAIPNTYISPPISPDQMSSMMLRGQPFLRNNQNIFLVI